MMIFLDLIYNVGLIFQSLISILFLIRNYFNKLIKKVLYRKLIIYKIEISFIWET